MSNITNDNINQIKEKLHQYNYEYYVLNKPSISDKEFDKIFDKLVAIENKHPELKTIDSPTQKVGSDLNQNLPEANHSISVLSLDKAYTIETLEQWIQKKETNTNQKLVFSIEQKIDGSSIVLYYEDGILSKAITRGNGLTGNDVTPNARTIRSIPLKLTMPVTVTVRGEIFTRISDFNNLNLLSKTHYANPRNFAAGAIRRIRSKEVALLPLRFIAYEGIFLRNQPTMHSISIEYLKELGLPVNENNHLMVLEEQLTDIKNAHQLWQFTIRKDLRDFLMNETKNRHNLDYEIDGIVLKVNEMSLRELIGSTDHHPKWAIAYKFNAPETESYIKNISVQIGRTGKLTPVANLKSILIAGSVVSRATLHNQNYISLMELCIGDSVSISKRGDVIPAVEKVLQKNKLGNKTWQMPKSCPSCQKVIVTIGSHQYCKNKKCPDQIRERIHFFIDKNQMNVKNIGRKTLDLLIDKKIITDIHDIFLFKIDDLVDWAGFGKQKIALIKEGIQKSKSTPFNQVLYSLGFFEIGPKIAKILIREGYSSIEAIIKNAQKRDLTLFTKLDGIGNVTASAIIKQFTDPFNLQMIEKLKKAGLNFSSTSTIEKKNLKSLRLSGQTWCITGSFNKYKPREKASNQIKANGGIVVSIINSKTTHLLAGKNPGSKLEKATSVGINIVNEKDFESLIS